MVAERECGRLCWLGYVQRFAGLPGPLGLLAKFGLLLKIGCRRPSRCTFLLLSDDAVGGRRRGVGGGGGGDGSSVGLSLFARPPLDPRPTGGRLLEFNSFAGAIIRVRSRLEPGRCIQMPSIVRQAFEVGLRMVGRR